MRPAISVRAALRLTPVRPLFSTHRVSLALLQLVTGTLVLDAVCRCGLCGLRRTSISTHACVCAYYILVCLYVFVYVCMSVSVCVFVWYACMYGCVFLCLKVVAAEDFMQLQVNSRVIYTYTWWNLRFSYSCVSDNLFLICVVIWTICTCEQAGGGNSPWRVVT